MRIPDAVLLRWDEIMARATDRTETCVERRRMRWEPDRPGPKQCVRRWGHRGRHVWRNA